VSVSLWHKFYTADIAAPPALLFGLLADMPNYGHWLPGSEQFGRTTDVQPYPVQLGSRYHDGKPDELGKDWWGEVVGFSRQVPWIFDAPSWCANCGQQSVCTSTTPLKSPARLRGSTAGWCWTSQCQLFCARCAG
jgi:hypothetical protein